MRPSYTQLANKDLEVRNKLKAISFESYIDYDSNSEQDEDHDEICKDDYCRCSTLRPVINSINKQAICNQICEEFGITDKRIISAIEKVCEKMTNDDFECQVVGGYYGEEMNGITLDGWQIVTDLENIIDLKKARKLKIEKLTEIYKETEKIKKILISEYGYLLENLKDAKFAIIEVSPNDIIFPSQRHLNEVSNENLESYKKHKICGIVREKDGKYLVIDGYHRIKANFDKLTIKVILVL